MRNCKPIETPVEKNVGLSLDMGPKTPEEREKMSRVPYSTSEEEKRLVLDQIL